MEEQLRDGISRASHGTSKFGEVQDPEAEIDPTDYGTIKKPINREPPMHDLVQSFITKIDNYDRNHGPIQQRTATEHVVTIDGLIPKEIKLSAERLITDFPQHKVTCALQCAGNRRHSMRTRVKEVQGVDWFDAAVMNCLWEGPMLRDVLLSAGLQMDTSSANRHVQFASYGSKVQEDDWYGGSIPLERAMDLEMDVILAVKMNHEPLSSRHGFPVRSIVPGVLGARSVKWLDRITISNQESPCFYQRHDYKILPPEAVDAESAEKYWADTPAMLDMPVNACVAYPTSGSTLTVSDPAGIVNVKGYAVPSGSDGPVVRVQVSTDEGETWVDAVLEDGGKLASKWSWVLWNADVKIEQGRGRKIWAKATDKGGNTQKEEKSTWNLRGVGYNGYEAVYDLTVQ